MASLCLMPSYAHVGGTIGTMTKWYSAIHIGHFHIWMFCVTIFRTCAKIRTGLSSIGNVVACETLMMLCTMSLLLLPPALRDKGAMAVYSAVFVIVATANLAMFAYLLVAVVIQVCLWNTYTVDYVMETIYACVCTHAVCVYPSSHSYTCKHR